MTATDPATAADPAATAADPTTTADPSTAASRPLASRERLERLAPTLVAAAFAAAYVLVSPPSLDLAAHLFRAQLFRVEGFGIWNNWWYSGHHIVGYSVLFPAISATLTPQLAGGIATTGTAALFALLARRHFGRRAWLGAVVFGAATAANLYTGRLAFAFGALPAVGSMLALDRRRPTLACALAVLAALSSPVAALFAALTAAGYALGALVSERRLQPALAGASVAVAAVVPVGLLAIAFPEGGSEPFAFSTLWPILLLAALGLATLPGEAVTLRAAVGLYTIVTIAVYVVPSPIGGNIARLGTLLAAPLAALLWWRRRTALLLIVALPLLYLEWAAPVRDLAGATGDQSTSTSYYRPLVQFLGRQTGPPFRTEIPFTRFHWEAYVVATHFPLARGWERQLDIKDNAIFYGGRLTASGYERWLHRNAVRFVAASDAQLDYSAQAEMALIRRGLPYLHQVMRSRHWRVYAVSHATPIVDGPATLEAMGPDWLRLRAWTAGSVLVHVRFTPYWALGEGRGCVAPAGQYTRLTLRSAGPVRLVARFSLGRIGARTPRCN
ncbi:MAG: hypothetical protein ACR2MK_07410 [Solirubrobacteraceae bacterium]